MPTRFRRVLFTFTAIMMVFPAASAGAMTIEYDDLGRIYKITYDNGSYVIYQYDAAGNRTTVTATS